MHPACHRVGDAGDASQPAIATGGIWELVTEGWIAELADLTVLRQRASRRADGPSASVLRIVDRDPRPGSAIEPA